MVKKKTGDFPLFLHGNGQWAKKIKGKFQYFGRDKRQAATRWDEERHALYAGRTPVKNDARPTLRELGNAFHDRYSKKVAAGEVSKTSLGEYKQTIARMIEFLGADCRPVYLSPLQFADLKDRFAEPVKRTTAIRGGVKGLSVERRSIVTVFGDLRWARAFLNWCRKSKLVRADLEFVPDFSPIACNTVRSRDARTARCSRCRSWSHWHRRSQRRSLPSTLRSAGRLMSNVKPIEVALTVGGDLGEVLRAVIDQSGLTRYSIANQAGISEATLSRFYTGARPTTLETLTKVCESLGRSLKVRVV